MACSASAAAERDASTHSGMPTRNQGPGPTTQLPSGSGSLSGSQASSALHQPSSPLHPCSALHSRCAACSLQCGAVGPGVPCPAPPARHAAAARSAVHSTLTHATTIRRQCAPRTTPSYQPKPSIACAPVSQHHLPIAAASSSTDRWTYGMAWAAVVGSDQTTSTKKGPIFTSAIPPTVAVEVHRP